MNGSSMDDKVDTLFRTALSTIVILVIYALILSIKALKIYISKNS